MKGNQENLSGMAKDVFYTEKDLGISGRKKGCDKKRYGKIQ